MWDGTALRRFAVVAKIALVLALLAGFIGVITLAYTEGEGNLRKSERGLWTEGVRQVLSMMDFGIYEASEAAGGFSKIALIQPDGGTLGVFLTGLVVVIGCYLLRFRFSWWPFHPLLFLIVGTWMGRMAWTSFLLGWVLKTLIVKVGGGRVYHSTKPLFIGFIIGELMIIATRIVVGFIYFQLTGKAGASFWMI